MNQGENPTKNPAFCILPWLHMYIAPTGDVFSCCVRSPDTPPLGNIHHDKPEEIWNGPQLRELRRDFLAGKRRPDNCAACYHNETAQTHSHRLQFNEQFKSAQAELVSSTDETGHLSKMKFLYWDFRFSNTCNLKCRSCGPEYSSSWRSDGEKLGWIPTETGEKKQDFNMYEFAIQNLSSVDAIYFAGGEPLLMKEHFDILNELLRRNKTQVYLAYNSNFSTLHFAKHSIVDLWRNFSDLHISPSVDHIGTKAEYVRKGIHWDRFVENVKTVRKELPWARINPTITISVFNILDLPEIHRNLMALNIINRDNPNGINLNLLRSPVYYNIAMLPLEFKKIAEEKLLAYQDEVRSKWNVSVPAFDNVLRALKDDLTQHLPEFLKITKALDEIREESFFEVFPEYKALMNHA